MSYLRSMSLGDFISLQRGHDLPADTRGVGAVPVMGSFGITGYHDQAKARGPGVTVGRSGASIGVVSYIERDYWPLNTCMYVTDFKENDPKFVYYYLSTLDLAAHNSGSAQPSLNRNYIYPIRIEVPPPVIQREIVATLGALDDKIELNRRTCATLEAMARALFRSWFVDFDPVHAKAAGEAPAHMDPATAALFPDRFGEDGLPEGWRIEALGQFYEVLETGKRPRGGVAGVSEGVPSVGAESIKRVGEFDYAKTKWVSRSFFDSMKKGHVEQGDVLVYKDGGKPGHLRPAVTYISMGFPFSEFAINEHVFRVRGRKPINPAYLYCALSSDDCMAQMQELATGVAQPGLNQSAMKSINIVVPKSTKVLEAFAIEVQPLLDACNSRATESQKLATLRDTLLPKLMSGELRVREAERQVAEVA